MLRKGCTGLLRQSLQIGLQQPLQQQQSCVQLQVLSLQAVRFRSKPSACAVTACLSVCLSCLDFWADAVTAACISADHCRPTQAQEPDEPGPEAVALAAAGAGAGSRCVCLVHSCAWRQLQIHLETPVACCEPLLFTSVSACLHCPSSAQLWYCRGQRSVTARTICTRACASCGSSSSSR